MSIFSEKFSEDHKFYFQLEYDNNKPSRLVITVYQNVTICDLADAIFDYCCGVYGDSLDVGEETIPCEVRRVFKEQSLDMKIQSYNCFEDVLSEIASQISISQIII